jgi:asparagine synthase (glutamine-hydrolysing)
MSLILALWNRDGEPVDETILRSMLALNTNPAGDGQDFWLQNSVALAHQHFWITPEEQKQPQPHLDKESGCVLTCAARLDNRPELMHALGLDQDPANSWRAPPRTAAGAGLSGLDQVSASALSDAELILKAYRRWGTECAPHLLGDFAFVLWDPAQQQMFAARDALGCQDLLYFYDKNQVLLATRLNLLLQHPAVQPRLNERKIAEFLAVQWGDDVNTYYDSIYHLPPAHCLLVTPESSRLWRYWQVDPENVIRYAQTEQYAEHYRELIKESLRTRLRSAYPMGISLSGGLDSTSLACLAAEVLKEDGAPPGRLSSYSYVFDEYSNCDERAYIQPVLEQAASLYPIRPRMVKGDSLWPRPFHDDWLNLRDYPGQDPYYYLVQRILQAAHQDGARLMLSGFFGDDLYSGSEYWLADPLMSGHFRQAARLLAQAGRQGTLKLNLLNLSLRGMLPAGLKKFYRRLRPRNPEWVEWIPPQFAARIGLARLDTSADIQQKFRLPGQQNRYSALFFNGYPESFSGYQIFGWENGVEFIFPYADRRIVEFVIALPTEQIALPDLSRRILREAMKGRLPETVRQREGKTDFFPLFDKGVYKENFPAITKTLLHSQVLERGYLRRDWLIGELERKTNTREGLIIWLALSVETWLQKYW